MLQFRTIIANPRRKVLTKRRVDKNSTSNSKKSFQLEKIENYDLVDKDPEKGLSRFQVVTDFIDA